MPRTLIATDGGVDRYEVTDSDGSVIGYDEQVADSAPDDGPTIDDAVQAASKATTIAALKAAVLTLAAAVEATA